MERSRLKYKHTANQRPTNLMLGRLMALDNDLGQLTISNYAVSRICASCGNDRVCHHRPLVHRQSAPPCRRPSSPQRQVRSPSQRLFAWPLFSFRLGDCVLAVGTCIDTLASVATIEPIARSNWRRPSRGSKPKGKR